MDEAIWFEELLLPPEEVVGETAKALEGLSEQRLAEEKALDMAAFRAAEDKAAFLDRNIREKARGVLRAHRPRWRPLTPEEAARLPTGLEGAPAGALARGDLYLVRLGMEFDVLPEGREAGWAYTAAWCRAYLFAPGSRVQPQVLALYPERLYEGKPTAVRVEVGLGLKAGPVEATPGKLSADLHLGQVTPVTLGFFGEEERAPYWELRAKEKPILGVYHFWLVVERPPGCDKVRLTALGEGDLRTRLFTIPVGPKERAWSSRRSIVLSA